MKKCVLLVFSLLTTLLAAADGVFEEEMAGTWILESSEGEFVYKGFGQHPLARPDVIMFYSEEQHQIENRESLGVAKFQSPEEYTIGIQDYFIYDGSSGRLRMHIHYAGGHNVVRYIINNINANRMELETYDKKGRVVYVRQGSQSSIIKSEQARSSNDYYSLKGEKLTGEPKSGAFIRGNKKYAIIGF